jgi:hypothetical protein
MMFMPISLGAVIVRERAHLDAAFRQLGVIRVSALEDLMVTAGMLSFAVLAERVGLVPAVTALVVLSALGERQLRPLTMGILAIALSLVGMLLFVKGFSLPFRAVRW